MSKYHQQDLKDSFSSVCPINFTFSDGVFAENLSVKSPGRIRNNPI